MLGGVVPAEDLFQPWPDGIAIAVPGKFVRVNQTARGNGADDDPVREAVARSQPQAARRFPVSDTEVVEVAFGIGGDGVIRLRATKNEGNHRLTRGSRAAVTAAGSPPPATAPNKRMRSLSTSGRDSSRSRLRLRSQTIQP